MKTFRVVIDGGSLADLIYQFVVGAAAAQSPSRSEPAPQVAAPSSRGGLYTVPSAQPLQRLEDAFLRWPVLPGAERYSSIDGKRLHELVVQQHGLESDDRVPIVLVDENDSKEIPAVEHSIEGSQILGRDIDEVVSLVSALAAIALIALQDVIPEFGERQTLHHWLKRRRGVDSNRSVALPKFSDRGNRTAEFLVILGAHGNPLSSACIQAAET